MINIWKECFLNLIHDIKIFSKLNRNVFKIQNLLLFNRKVLPNNIQISLLDLTILNLMLDLLQIKSDHMSNEEVSIRQCVTNGVWNSQEQKGDETDELVCSTGSV